jgi:hypothetical protein
MTGNTNFPSPNPPLTTLQTLLAESQARAAEYVAALNAVAQALTRRDLARKALADAYEQDGTYVQSQSGGGDRNEDVAVWLGFGNAGMGQGAGHRQPGPRPVERSRHEDRAIAITGSPWRAI